MGQAASRPMTLAKQTGRDQLNFTPSLLGSSRYGKLKALSARGSGTLERSV